MDMLEDYLRAVSRLLPRAKREDIIAELRDEILTRIEAREGELGRTLSPDETENLLREFGHPIVIAARYRDEPQYSVGPALYPYWMFAVRFAIILEIALSTLVFIGRVAGGADVSQAFSQAIGSGIGGVMTLIGFATVAAWIIERKGITIGYFKTWRVRDLRFLDFAFWDWADVNEWLQSFDTSKRPRSSPSSAYSRQAYADTIRDHVGHHWSPHRASAGNGVGAVVVAVVFILWWTGAISFGLHPTPVDFAAMHIDPGALANVDYAAMKADVYWPVLAYYAALGLFGAAVLVYPRGIRLRGLLDIVIGLATLALALWVWTASPVAEIVRVDSAQALWERIGAFFAHPVPVPLELLATVFLICLAFGGFCRATGGLWEVLTGAPRYPQDQ